MRTVMFEQAPKSGGEKTRGRATNFIAQIFGATAPYLWRIVFVLIGAGAILLAVRMMLHGDFTFYERGPEPAWDFVPPFVIVGAFCIYIGLRKERDDDRDSADK
jgi:hypothetical protein